MSIQTTEERQLLKDVLRLWNAVRMESMSEFICSDETLGMRPQDWDADCNCYGRVLVPPVISAQIQLLMTVKVMQPLKASVLRILKKLVQKNDSKTWFTRYLCIFVLLHSCALLTSHENRRAKKSGFQVGCSKNNFAFNPTNDSKSRYVTKAFVEELHQGANIMLAFFHYCNKGSRPFAPDFWNSSCHVAMAQLDEEQLNFLRTTSEQIRQKGEYSNHGPGKSSLSPSLIAMDRTPLQYSQGRQKLRARLLFSGSAVRFGMEADTDNLNCFSCTVLSFTHIKKSISLSRLRSSAMQHLPGSYVEMCRFGRNCCLFQVSIPFIQPGCA